jgi:hypothetical protein
MTCSSSASARQLLECLLTRNRTSRFVMYKAHRGVVVDVQAAVKRATVASTLLTGFQMLSFICIVLDTFGTMGELPVMAVVTHALAHSLPELVILALVVGTLMACMAMVLYVMSPPAERLSRLDLLVSYMFGGLVAGASPIRHGAASIVRCCVSLFTVGTTQLMDCSEALLIVLLHKHVLCPTCTLLSPLT